MNNHAFRAASYLIARDGREDVDPLFLAETVAKNADGLLTAYVAAEEELICVRAERDRLAVAVIRRPKPPDGWCGDWVVRLAEDGDLPGGELRDALREHDRISRESDRRAREGV